VIKRIPFYYLGALVVGVPITLQFAYYVLENVGLPVNYQVFFAAIAGNLLAARMFRKKLADTKLITHFWMYLAYGVVTMALVTTFSFGLAGLVFGTLEVLSNWWWVFIPSSLTVGVLLRQFDAMEKRVRKPCLNA
jgi:hypothetical protein